MISQESALQTQGCGLIFLFIIENIYLKTLKNFSSDIKILENLIKNCKEKEIFNILKKNKEIRKSILKITD